MILSSLFSSPHSLLFRSHYMKATKQHTLHTIIPNRRSDWSFKRFYIISLLCSWVRTGSAVTQALTFFYVSTTGPFQLWCGDRWTFWCDGISNISNDRSVCGVDHTASIDPIVIVCSRTKCNNKKTWFVINWSRLIDREKRFSSSRLDQIDSTHC